MSWAWLQEPILADRASREGRRQEVSPMSRSKRPAIAATNGGPPKAEPEIIMVGITWRDMEGRVTQKHLNLREKIKPGLWREHIETRDYEPEKLK